MREFKFLHYLLFLLLLQKHILCLNGPVVTLAGLKDELAIVTHASDSLPSGDQVCLYLVVRQLKCLQITMFPLQATGHSGYLSMIVVLLGLSLAESNTYENLSHLFWTEKLFLQI